MPRGFLEQRADKILPEKSQPIVVYCAGGTRSALAAKTLQDMGYTDVSSMRGGFTEWKNNGLPFVSPEKVGKDQNGAIQPAPAEFPKSAKRVS